MLRKACMIFGFLIWSSVGLAWSSTGHRVVAQIAYAHLTPKAKKAVDRLTYVPGEHYSGRSRFVYISTWADVARSKGDNRFTTWHYIDIPISKDGTKTRKQHIKNAVYGIKKSYHELQYSTSVDDEKTYLKLLVHLVGDVHQPLHAANRFSHEHPRGDYGANQFKIKSRFGRSLHSYWDNGLGLFTIYEQRYPLRRGNLRKLADDIETKFPESSFSKKYLHRTPMYWALESHALAKRYVYHIKEGTQPSRQYRLKGQDIAERRLALAGYRLADMLNQIYS